MQRVSLSGQWEVPALVMAGTRAAVCCSCVSLRAWWSCVSLRAWWAAGKTHRELFSEFYADLLRQPLEEALAVNPRPAASVHLFQRMMADIMASNGDCIEQVSRTPAKQSRWDSQDLSDSPHASLPEYSHWKGVTLEVSGSPYNVHA